MNDSPWRVDDMARMERERIREEMREIRMAEAAQRAHSPRVSWAARLAAQLSSAIRSWFQHAERSARTVQPQPHRRLHARPHAHA